MKQFRFWHRLILFIGALLVILTGIALLLPLFFKEVNVAELMQKQWVQIVVYAVSALDILFGLYLFTVPHKFVIRKKDFVTRQTENGELRIAVVAIKNLVKKCVDAHEEVTLNSMRIHNVRDGVTVDLSISLANNIIIPLVVSSLQKKVKQYLQTSSGIEVKEVRVAVETAKDAANYSPYMVKDDAAEAEEAQPAKQKKQPIHQRLFKRDAEPAVLPEAPAEAADEPMEEAAQAVEEITEEIPAAAEEIAEEAAEEMEAVTETIEENQEEETNE